jgi:hypothetical protein
MTANSDRRKFLRLVGGSAAIVPFAGLAGCGGGDEAAAPPPPAASAPEPEKAPAAAEPATMPEPAEAPSASASLTPLKDEDPQAQALAYVSNAENVDREAQPRYEPGQACANCALFMGEEGAANGPCSIFPGRLVAATGWCSVYAPKA